jgi:hypothetical protein
MAEFDLSGLSEMEDRTRLRTARLLAWSILVVIAGALAVRLYVQGIDELNLSILTFGIVLESFLLWFVLRYAALGPMSVEVSEGQIQFRYKNGALDTVETKGHRTHVTLAEVLPPEASVAARVLPRAPCSARISLRELPLTLEAFKAIDQELRRAGRTQRILDRQNPPWGGVRLYRYS